MRFKPKSLSLLIYFPSQGTREVEGVTLLSISMTPEFKFRGSFSSRALSTLQDLFSMGIPTLNSSLLLPKNMI